jgi:hypothetical protein
MLYTTADANAEVAVATSDLGYYFKNLGYENSVNFFSTQNAYFAVAAAARCLQVDFNQPNSTNTWKFKQLVGVAPEAISETQRQTLEGKNYNYYATVGSEGGGFPMIAQGKTASGRFCDSVHNCFWFQSEAQTALFNGLATTPTKIAQTDKGAAVLVQKLTTAFDKGLRNGMFAAGTWKGDDLGELKTGDYLENGYYVTAGNVADMSDADKASRQAPPLTAAANGGSAIHFAALVVNFRE